MSPVYASKRRADEFQALVEGGGSADAPLGDLLVLVESLRAVEHAAPRPEFSTTLRERLMAAAETELAAGTVDARLTVPTRRTKRERRIAAAVGGLALVGASSGLAAAAQTSLPGDPLYPLKRAIENAQTGLTMGDEAKGATLLSNAQDRLDELNRLAARGDDEATVSQTLDDFSTQATEASDLLLADYAESGHASSITELRDFTGSSLDSLADLAPQLDGSAHGALVHAADVLTRIDAEAERACPTCGGQGIGDLPAILASARTTTPSPTTPPSSSHSGEVVSAGATQGGSATGGGGKTGAKPSTSAPSTGAASGSGDPLQQLDETVTGDNTGTGSSTTGGGSSGSGSSNLPIPGLPTSTDTSSGDPIGGLGDAIGDGTSGVGDTLKP